MRMISYSLMALAMFAVWEFKASRNAVPLGGEAELASGQNIDPIVTGFSMPEGHVAKWEARKAQNDACGGCLVADQPYPGDLDK